MNPSPRLYFALLICFPELNDTPSVPHAVAHQSSFPSSAHSFTHPSRPAVNRDQSRVGRRMHAATSSRGLPQNLLPPTLSLSPSATEYRRGRRFGRPFASQIHAPGIAVQLVLEHNRVLPMDGRNHVDPPTSVLAPSNKSSCGNGPLPRLVVSQMHRQTHRTRCARSCREPQRSACECTLGSVEPPPRPFRAHSCTRMLRILVSGRARSAGVTPVDAVPD